MNVVPHARLRLVAFSLMVLGAAPGCGIVRYGEMTITVRDELTKAPVPHAYVAVLMVGEMGKWNCGKVPLNPHGYTDEHGAWRVTLPKRRFGVIMVDSLGYERRQINVERGTVDDGELEIKLTPGVSEFTRGSTAGSSISHGGKKKKRDGSL